MSLEEHSDSEPNPRSELEERRRKLSSQKAELLARRLQSARQKKKMEPTIPVNPSDTGPLTFPQEQQWMLSNLHADAAVCNVPRAFQLSGPLSTTALKQSVNAIVARHAILRTTFMSDKGKLVQRVSPSLTVEMPIHERPHLPDTERENEVQLFAAREAKKSFNLKELPLIRMELLRYSDNDHVLLLTTHHTIADEWSVGVFFREMVALYQSICIGSESELSALPIQFKDFAAWQRANDDSFTEGIDYFVEQLEGAPSLLALPLDFPRPSAQSTRGAKECVTIAAPDESKLNSIAQEQHATPFMALLTVFQGMLHRVTCQDDIVVGFPVAVRPVPEVQNLIGVFINTVVLRTEFSDKLTYSDLLSQIRDRAVAAYAHQNIPFAKLIERLNPPRNPQYSPIFQVLFNLEDFPVKDCRCHDIDISEIDFDPGIVQCDLTLEIIRKADGLDCQFSYNADVFEAKTIKRIATHFLMLLQGVIADPNVALNLIPLTHE